MLHHHISTSVLAVAILLGGCSGSPSGDSPRVIPDRPEDVRPLDVGDVAPRITVTTPDGHPIATAGIYAQSKTVLIFYRGGWCPYCTVQLQGMTDVEAQLREQGIQIVAVSPDRPEELTNADDEHDFGYQLLSDGDMALARAFGLAFRVDPDEYRRLQGFGIDLEASSGRDHHLLPVPAVYLIDRGGVIRFAHWDSDYTRRLSVEALLEAAKTR